MTEAVIVALITGACAIIGQMMVSRKASTDMYSRLDKQLAVMANELQQLADEVKKHNNFAQRIPVIETKVSVLEKEVDKIQGEKK